MTAPRELARLLRRHAGERPDVVALRGGTPNRSRSMTWREVDERTRVAAAAAVEVGDRALVVVDNSLASVVVLLGLLCAGVEVLLAEPAERGVVEWHPALRARGRVPVVGPDDYERFVPDTLSRSIDLPEPRRGDPEVILTTSGSTGEPKLARQSLRNVLRSGALHRDLYRLTPADTLLVTIPLAHSYGLTVGLAAAVTAGSSLCLLTPFRPSTMLVELDSGVTVLLTVPFVYGLIASAPQRRTGARATLRLALSGGSPLAPDTARRACDALGCPVYQNYGSVEVNVVAAQHDRPEPWADGSVGVAVPGVRWRVESDGRLLVRTSTMFAGYLGAEADPLGPDGFYDTGDVVRVDDTGQLFVEGRLSGFINVGGRKVNPRRIEAAIEGHPLVREVAVYGIHNGQWGEEIHAAVSLAGDSTAEDVIRLCRGRLAGHEVPHYVHVLDRLPRTGRGKLDRARLPAARS